MRPESCVLGGEAQIAHALHEVVRLGTPCHRRCRHGGLDAAHDLRLVAADQGACDFLDAARRTRCRVEEHLVRHFGFQNALADDDVKVEVLERVVLNIRRAIPGIAELPCECSGDFLLRLLRLAKCLGGKGEVVLRPRDVLYLDFAILRERQLAVLVRRSFVEHGRLARVVRDVQNAARLLDDSSALCCEVRNIRGACDVPRCLCTKAEVLPRSGGGCPQCGGHRAQLADAARELCAVAREVDVHCAAVVANRALCM